MGYLTESLVVSVALAWLSAIGWRIAYSPDIWPGVILRRAWQGMSPVFEVA